MSLGSFFSGVVGAVVGFVLGGPVGAMYGFQIGSLAGSVIFPDKLPAQYGPRLQDSQTTTASVGDPIARVWGTGTVGGTVIYLGELVETVTKRKVGKWPAKQTIYEYQYSQTIAIGLCEGPITGIRRVWENGVLVYDVRPPIDGESDADYSARVAQSDKYAAGFTLYTGTESQTADPTLSAEAGTAGVPGYRGLAYLVYPSRVLSDNQGRRHPQFKFEVVALGAYTETVITEYANEALLEWPSISTTIGTAVAAENFFRPGQTYEYRAINHDTGGYYPDSANRGSLLAAADYCKSGTEIGQFSGLIGWDKSANYPLDDAAYPYRAADTGLDPRVPSNAFDRIRYAIFNYRAPSGYADIGWDSAGTFDNFVTTNNLLGKWWSGRRSGAGTAYTHGVIVATNLAPPAGQYSTASDVAVEVRRVPMVPLDISHGKSPAPIAGYYIDDDGSYVKQTPWTLVSGTFRVLTTAAYSGGGVVYDTLSLGPVLPSTDANYSNSAYWLAAYNAAKTAGTAPAGLIYNSAGGYGVTQAWAYQRTVTRLSLASERAPLSTIVSDLCAEAGLTDVDVSDLAGVELRGFVRGQVMTARSAIESLRAVGLFDCVESNFTLKFPARGKASVRTFSTTDLAAHAQGDEIPSGVETRKLQDPELPRTLRVAYHAYSRDYEVGEQISPTRINSTAVNTPTLTIPAVLDDDQAAQAAEIAWAEAWAGRWAHRFAVDGAHLDLEVSDVVTIPVDGRNTRVRITSIDDRIVGVRQIEAARDDLAIYTSTATGTGPSNLPGGKLAVLGTPYFEALDLPYLGLVDPRASSGNADVLALIRQDGGNAWYGSMIGTGTTDATFDVLSTIYTAPAYGTVVSAAGSGPTTILDIGSTLIVELADEDGTLSAATDAEIRDGTNLCAVGVNGRWEVLQFGAVSQVSTSPNRWTLSRLARGRRGTEWAVGTGVANDRFVMLVKGQIGVVPLTTDLIGQSRTYSIVNIEANREASVADGTQTTYAATATHLKPLAPVNIKGAVDGSGDWTITWSRRDRVAQELADTGRFALSEESEKYEVEILDGLTVKRTISTTTEQAVYVASNQSADFGSTQSSITVRIYQLSAVVGRGYGATETLTS